MLYSLDAYQRRCARHYSVADLSVIVAIRAHDNNPWVAERLDTLGGYYDPGPHFVIVDFGSEPAYRDELKSISDRHGFNYTYVDDTGTFCLAKARNAGAIAAKTELLFFSDIDCFGERDLCARLVEQANRMQLGAIYDQIIKLPVYHLGPDTTASFFSANTHEQRSARVAQAFSDGVYSGRGEPADFIDPSSNFFVCRRSFYDEVGGYNQNFRGHGSEDYEFLLRFALLSGQFPIPADPNADQYGPTRRDFYGPKSYRGFRRLGELMSYQAELAGLRIAHMHHGRPNAADTWYDNNDWGRTRFHEQVDPLLDRPSSILAADWMPREKRCAVLLRHEWHYEFFLPLRAAGYELVPITLEALRDGDLDPGATGSAGATTINGAQFDAVAIFNPYMRSHDELRPYFDRARDRGLEPIVVERGALPESWYFAPEVCYGDPEWKTPAALDGYTPTAEERAIAKQYMDDLSRGAHTLEENGAAEDTLACYRTLVRRYPHTCLIPLQLDDDLAVTRFTDGFSDYPTFRDDTLRIPKQFPDTLFLIKPHPLAKAQLTSALPNVHICSDEDNVHALMSLVDSVIVYNSGVGLLGILQGKPVVSVGNAFYNLPGLGRRAEDLAGALAAARAEAADFLSRDVEHLVAWLLFRKYTFFSADSVVRDFGDRKSHEYRNLRCYQLGTPGSRSCLRARVSRPFSYSSYASARLGVGIAPAGPRSAGGQWRRAWIDRLLGADARPLSPLQRKLRKLGREPKRFFVESRHPAMRWIGARLPSD